MTVFEFQEKYPTREAKEEALKHMTDEEIDEIIASCTTTQGKIWYSQHKRGKKKAERKGAPPRSKLRLEDLEDGKLLKYAIHRYRESGSKEALFTVCKILRDSYVWIPCHAIIGEEDKKAWDEIILGAEDDLDSLIGKELVSTQQIRMVPDILQSGDEYFFPAFTTQEDMGEYGEGFSTIQEHFMTAIEIARGNRHEGQELAGIVVNAFTEPFVLPKEGFGAVEKMESRME